MPKYPEVSTFSLIMSSKMLFVQSSSQLRQVALVISVQINQKVCAVFEGHYLYCTLTLITTTILIIME